ncbi:Spy/CpxP family protein refolding chaperone [Gilvimarinus xylanilyticus]|uniref:Spy/CpxP family protein refolding chaperone n=1 Tax=Gilvimarinus xylanilyticus TaxID=2944139 RepID=A0A9X2HST0_9GAMM|nr:Spy/CpxP family protein refolding chaperone [Gilvimarinus xylanilyticus]MCP8897888.1 Spy/CpxP family protein refolding chaperone [Gilvimarinus xylanilyticus]
MKKLISTLTLCALASAPLAVYAERGERPDHAPHSILLSERVAEKLNLSDEQSSQIRVLLDNHTAVYPRDRDTRKAQREATDALIQAQSFDEAAARELLSQKLERELAALKLRHDINQVLSAEQREQLQQMKQRMKKRFAKKHRKSRRD